MQPVFQLILPFQLELPFEAPGQVAVRSSGTPRMRRTTEAKRARRARLAASSLELPMALGQAAAMELER